MTNKSLSDIDMPKIERFLKYPELIAYYRIKGYRVETDSDLRDLHAWIPLELYAQLMAKSSSHFSRERGKVSKAVAEAVKKWLKDEKDV